MTARPSPAPQAVPRRRPGRRRTRLALAIAAAAGAVLVLAGHASADVYWANSTFSSEIRRANDDGSGSSRVTLANVARGVAVHRGYVYYANFNASSIGRVRLDGTDSQVWFITGASAPFGVAVDDRHVYWTNEGDNSIGRANLDGTGVDQRWITGISQPQGIAVDGEHVYWGAKGTNSIGRANLDGTAIEPHLLFVGAGPGDGNGVRGIAIDDRHVYWANVETNQIGRANLDGSNPGGLIGNAGSPTGVAVDGKHVYWTNTGTDSIGRANLDGSGFDHGFVTTAVDFPIGIAVAHGSPSASSTSLDFGRHATGTIGQPQRLTITNRGSDELGLGQVRVSGSNPDDFLVSSDGCSLATLAIGESCELGVRFGPSASGARAATLVLDSDSTTGPVRVALSGAGASPAPPSGEAPPTGEPPPPPAEPAAPSNDFRIVTVTSNRRKGTATVTVEVPGPGSVELAATRALARTSATAQEAGELSLPVRPRGDAKRKLRERGRARVRAEITFTPDGGEPSTQSAPLRLRRNPK